MRWCESVVLAMSSLVTPFSFQGPQPDPPGEVAKARVITQNVERREIQEIRHRCIMRLEIFLQPREGLIGLTKSDVCLGEIITVCSRFRVSLLQLFDYSRRLASLACPGVNITKNSKRDTKAFR